MSEFEGRGKSFDVGYARARRSTAEPRERTANERAADARTLARNLEAFEQRVHDGIAAMGVAAQANDRATWDAAKRDADAGVMDIRASVRAALAAANDATDEKVRQRLAAVENTVADAARATDAASKRPPEQRTPELRIADELLAALPPDHPVSPAESFYKQAQLAVEWVLRERASTSDLTAFREIVAGHREHEIARRFRRFGAGKQGALLALLEDDKVKLAARQREQQQRAAARRTATDATPIRHAADPDGTAALGAVDRAPVEAAPAHDAPEHLSIEATPTERERAVAGEREPQLDDDVVVQRKARGADAVEHDGQGELVAAVDSEMDETARAAPSTGDAARPALGPQIAAAAGAIYAGAGIFELPEFPDVVITVQRTARAAQRRRAARDIVLEIPLGLTGDELARVTIEQLTSLRTAPPATPEDVAADGVRDAAEPLPHHDEIERSFGEHRIDHVRAQVGGSAAGAAAQLGATAYATGDRVGFAGSPSLHTAAHEAAHVVQQRAGVALKGNVGQAGDAYEQHADAVADHVVRGESAEALLDEIAPRASGAGGATSAVQRKEQGARSTGATAARGDQELVRKADQPWSVFAASGKPYIIEARDRPGAWIARDWVKAAPDVQQKAGGWIAPSRARELLIAMGWVEPERIDVAADRLVFRFTRSYDYLPIDARGMHATGLPAGKSAVVERGPEGALRTTIRLDDPSLPPDARHEMTASERTRVIRAFAEFTELPVEPDSARYLDGMRTAPCVTGNGTLLVEWKRTLCRVLFGYDAYERWWTGKPPAPQPEDDTPKHKLANYYQRPIPGELSHHADIVESGEQVRVEALVNWPTDTPNPAIYEIVPMVTPSKFGTVALLQCSWRFERLPAGSSTPAAPPAPASATRDPRGDAATVPADRLMPSALPASAGTATSASPTSAGTATSAPPAGPVASPEKSGAPPEQTSTEIAEVFHRFTLAPGEARATFRVTCEARCDAYFSPTTFTRDVVVMSSAAALASLRTQAFAGLGSDDAQRRGNAWTADASAALTASPPTGSTDATARARSTQRTQLEAVRVYLANNPASADAVAAIDRELARQAQTEQLLAQDRARGWQPFQVRGTYLSRTEGLASGPLDLHGTVHVVPHYDVDPSDGGSTVQSTRSDQYIVQIRDLSRRFEQQDFIFEGRGVSFDRALSDAFEDLAVAYPKGMVAIEAEQLASRAGAADGEAMVGARTGKVVGFQRSTETTWKKVKETVWDPVASLAVNLGAIALMTLVPGSAAIVAPAIIAYNSVPAVDRIATEGARGTLTTDRFATAAGEIALNLLPLVGRARPFTAGWFAVETTNWGGQVALLTASAVDVARGLQAQEVVVLAAQYEAFLQLQKRSLPSDPNLAAAEAEIRNRAAKVADVVSQQIDKQIHENAIVMVTGSVVHNTSVHARTALLEYLGGRPPSSGGSSARAPDSAPPRPGNDHGHDAPKSGSPEDRTVTSRSDGGAVGKDTPSTDANSRSDQHARVDISHPATHAPPQSEQHVPPENLRALRGAWRRQSAALSELHYDPATNSSYFDVTEKQGQTQRIRARLAAPIRTAAELIVDTNRIVGHPIAKADADEIMHSLVRGELQVLERVGVKAWNAKLPPGIEFGLGALADGRVVVIRGEPKAVDWSALPGVTPIAHTHPDLKGRGGNDLEAAASGRHEATLGELTRVTDGELINRPPIFPSPEDFIVMGTLDVARHRVYTPYVVHDGIVTKPVSGDTSPRLAWDIIDTHHVGVDRAGQSVFHAIVEGTAGNDRIFRRDIWIVQDKNGAGGKLAMERPDGLDAPAAVPAPRTWLDRGRLWWTQRRLQAAAYKRVPVGRGRAHYDLRVLPVDEFRARFRSEAARAKFELEPPADQQVIYARADASEADVVAETQHVKQMEHPDTAAEIRRHHGEDFAKNWDRLSVSDRLAHFLRKLDIELDAYGALSRQGDSAAATTIGNLEKLRDQAEALMGDAEQVAQINARLLPMPGYLVDPAHLFHKDAVVIESNGPRTERNAVVDPATMAVLPATGAERSAAYMKDRKRSADVVAVRQVGVEWLEADRISSGYSGTVTIEHEPAGVTVVVTNDSGKRHVYKLEEGAQLHVESGARIQAGHVLAVQPSRRYRLVEIERNDGSKPERREEIRKHDGNWVQRGSDSTRAGALLEDAARSQVDAQLAAKKAAADKNQEYFDSARLPHARGGGGFDDVIVEFTGSAAKPEAKVRIREVKNYPDRRVPVAEFTAIQGDDLSGNMRELEGSVERAIKARDEGRPFPGFEKLSAEQLQAVQEALDQRHIEFEIILGPTTKMGRESGPHSVLRKLRQGIQAIVNTDALKITGGIHIPEHVDQSWVDQASNSAKPKTP